MHLASFPCCSQQIPPAERAEGEGSPLHRAAAESSETPAVAGPPTGQRRGGRAGAWEGSAWDELGNLKRLHASSHLSCGTRAVPEQASPWAPSAAQQLCARTAVPMPQGSGSSGTGSKPSTGTAGMHQLSQHSQTMPWEQLTPLPCPPLPAPLPNSCLTREGTLQSPIPPRPGTPNAGLAGACAARAGALACASGSMEGHRDHPRGTGA